MGKSCEVDVTDPDVAAAITEVNEEFRKGYRHVLEDIGTHYFDLDRAQAFRTMQTVLQEFGFRA